MSICAFFERGLKSAMRPVIRSSKRAPIAITISSADSPTATWRFPMKSINLPRFRICILPTGAQIASAEPPRSGAMVVVEIRGQDLEEMAGVTGFADRFGHCRHRGDADQPDTPGWKSSGYREKRIEFDRGLQETQ